MTTLELAKLTQSREEQILVCAATNYSENKEYGQEQYDWLVNNLVYSYKQISRGNVTATLIKVEDKAGKFIYGMVLQQQGENKKTVSLNIESNYNNAAKQF